ncbi:MAG: hypothetical protein ACLTYN_10950 [Dysosmobacter welbionis]
MPLPGTRGFRGRHRKEPGPPRRQLLPETAGDLYHPPHRRDQRRRGRRAIQEALADRFYARGPGPHRMAEDLVAGGGGSSKACFSGCASGGSRRRRKRNGRRSTAARFGLAALDHRDLGYGGADEMNEMKKISLIGTGGTIALDVTDSGLAPS